MNRNFHERGGVIRVNDLHPRREKRLHLRQFSANSVGGIQRVRAGSQFNTQTGCRLAVKLRHYVIAFAAQLNFGDITQTNLGTVLVHLQQDVAKLFRIGQTRLCDDRGVKLLAFHRRRTA